MKKLSNYSFLLFGICCLVNPVSYADPVNRKKEPHAFTDNHPLKANLPVQVRNGTSIQCHQVMDDTNQAVIFDYYASFSSKGPSLVFRTKLKTFGKPSIDVGDWSSEVLSSHSACGYDIKVGKDCKTTEELLDDKNYTFRFDCGADKVWGTVMYRNGDIAYKCEGPKVTPDFEALGGLSEGCKLQRAEPAAGRFKSITKIASNPGCHLIVNAVVISALLKETETEAQKECKTTPVLTDLKTEIKTVGGCTPVTVKATYRCE